MSLEAAYVTVQVALAETAARLAAAGIEEARREARVLLAAALGWDRAELLARNDVGLGDAARTRLAEMVARRASREPVARILGHREFWSLRFEIAPETLDPRADSETLIEAALAALDDRARPYRVLDFGTGTGCLLLALLSELPTAEGLGIDGATGAIEVARRNAAALGLAPRARFRLGDWGRGIDGAWDVILANPPYIASGEIDGSDAGSGAVRAAASPRRRCRWARCLPCPRAGDRPAAGAGRDRGPGGRGGPGRRSAGIG